MKHLRHLAFVFLCACITAVMSERIFWFWSPGLAEHLAVSAFYALPVAFTLWAMATYRVNGVWSVLLAAPLYAYVTEGVITPILYTGGPFVPFFPAWFAFWHGIMAFGFLLLAVRHWLLAQAWKPLALTAVGTGLFWGIWASTLRLPENVNDEELIADLGEPLTVLGPAAFAFYALLFTGVLAAAHWLLGYVWPESYAPGRPTKVVVAGLVVAGAAMWTVAAVWALPMFIAYAGLQRWGLRRHAATAAEPDVVRQLHGRVRVRSLVPLFAIAPVAAGSYAVLWALDPSTLALQVIFYSVIAAQAVAGGWLTVAALRRTKAERTTTHAAQVEPAATLY